MLDNNCAKEYNKNITAVKQPPINFLISVFFVFPAFGGENDKQLNSKRLRGVHLCGFKSGVRSENRAYYCRRARGDQQGGDV